MITGPCLHSIGARKCGGEGDGRVVYAVATGNAYKF